MIGLKLTRHHMKWLVLNDYTLIKLATMTLDELSAIDTQYHEALKTSSAGDIEEFYKSYERKVANS